MTEKKFFLANDVNLVVPFLEAKNLLPKNSEKKFKIEKYIDSNNSSLMALIYKKHKFLKREMIASFEIDFNYDVYKNIKGKRICFERTIYFPHFRQNEIKKCKNLLN